MINKNPNINEDCNNTFDEYKTWLNNNYIKILDDKDMNKYENEINILYEVLLIYYQNIYLEITRPELKDKLYLI